MNSPAWILSTPARLHFGLLAWGGSLTRQFGSVGLMVRDPGFRAWVRPARDWSASGPSSTQVLATLDRVRNWLRERDELVHPRSFEVLNAPPAHSGLGSGTQISLAVARAALMESSARDCTLDQLALIAGRGRRSGIGIHGFDAGGLIVDGGHRADRAESARIPPKLARLNFPTDWSVLLALPDSGPGLHGTRELRAFQNLPPMLESTSDRPCRLVLMGLLPAVVEQDLPAFGASLEEIQELVGRAFLPAQGGEFASSEVEAIVSTFRHAGLFGVGQSSWGPTVYGFSDQEPAQRQALRDQLADRLSLPPDRLFWTVGDLHGFTLTPTTGESPVRRSTFGG